MEAQVQGRFTLKKIRSKYLILEILQHFPRQHCLYNLFYASAQPRQYLIQNFNFFRKLQPIVQGMQELNQKLLDDWSKGQDVYHYIDLLKVESIVELSKLAPFLKTKEIHIDQLEVDRFCLYDISGHDDVKKFNGLRIKKLRIDNFRPHILNDLERFKLQELRFKELSLQSINQTTQGSDQIISELAQVKGLRRISIDQYSELTLKILQKILYGIQQVTIYFNEVRIDLHYFDRIALQKLEEITASGLKIQGDYLFLRMPSFKSINTLQTMNFLKNFISLELYLLFSNEQSTIEPVENLQSSNSRTEKITFINVPLTRCSNFLSSFGQSFSEIIIFSKNNPTQLPEAYKNIVKIKTTFLQMKLNGYGQNELQGFLSQIDPQGLKSLSINCKESNLGDSNHQNVLPQSLDEQLRQFNDLEILDFGLAKCSRLNFTFSCFDTLQKLHTLNLKSDCNQFNYKTALKILGVIGALRKLTVSTEERLREEDIQIHMLLEKLDNEIILKSVDYYNYYTVTFERKGYIE